MLGIGELIARATWSEPAARPAALDPDLPLLRTFAAQAALRDTGPGVDTEA